MDLAPDPQLAISSEIVPLRPRDDGWTRHFDNRLLLALIAQNRALLAPEPAAEAIRAPAALATPRRVATIVADWDGEPYLWARELTREEAAGRDAAAAEEAAHRARRLEVYRRAAFGLATRAEHASIAAANQGRGGGGR